MADKCEESNSEEVLNVSGVKDDLDLDDTIITKHMKDEEVKYTSEIRNEPTTNCVSNKLYDETDNANEINPEEQQICAHNKSYEGKDSDLVKDNLDNNDCGPKSPKSVIDNNKHQLNIIPSDNSANSTDITLQTSTNSDVNDRNMEVDTVKTVIEQENGDSLITDLNKPTYKGDSLVLNTHNLVTDHKSESNLVSKSEDLVETCSEANKSSSEQLPESGRKEVVSIDINEQSETKDANVDESENVDTIQPVVLEVKSIVTDIKTQNIVDLLDAKVQDEVDTNKPIQSVSDDKAETMDTKSEICEEPKKIARFEEDNKGKINTGAIEFETFAIKSEIFEEEENITDVADENEIAVKMEVDENMDEGVGTSSEYNDEIKENDSYSSEIKPPTREIKENIEDGIFIEVCKPGVNESSDRPKAFIIEGSAEILLSSPKNVFYNPVQEFNRDMR